MGHALRVTETEDLFMAVAEEAAVSLPLGSMESRPGIAD